MVLPSEPGKGSTPPVGAFSFGNISDGLSYTALFGEKHMYKDWEFGKTANLDGICATLGSTSTQFNSIIRRMGSPDEADGICTAVGVGILGPNVEGDRVVASFGSWHPKTCQFGMGDGSVQRISNNLDPVMCARLIQRSDGGSLTLEP